MPQRTGAVESDPFAGLRGKRLDWFSIDHFHEVACQVADASSLFRVVCVVAKEMPILLHERTATTCSLNDSFSTRFHRWPPGVDIFARSRKSSVLIIQVIFRRSTATGTRRMSDTDAEAIEDPSDGYVRVR